jgi:hypothetical protein
LFEVHPETQEDSHLRLELFTLCQDLSTETYEKYFAQEQTSEKPFGIEYNHLQFGLRQVLFELNDSSKTVKQHGFKLLQDIYRRTVEITQRGEYKKISPVEGVVALSTLVGELKTVLTFFKEKYGDNNFYTILQGIHPRLLLPKSVTSDEADCLNAYVEELTRCAAQDPSVKDTPYSPRTFVSGKIFSSDQINYGTLSWTGAIEHAEIMREIPIAGA